MLSPAVLEDSAWSSLLAPAWLGKVLGGCTVREVAVDHMTGDGYASTMVRARVTLDDKQVKQIIVKRPPPEEASYYFPFRAAFDVEVRVYSEVIPRVQRLLQSAAKDQPALFPRMLHRVDNPTPTLFFEDISVQGFRMASRMELLDVAHVRLTLRALARWHAATSVLLQAQPELFKNMDHMVCEEHAVFLDGFLVKGFHRFVRHAEAWQDELSRRTVAKLRRLLPDCRQRILEAYRPPPLGEGFNVGLHGDLWCGNMLYRYGQDGEPEEVRLLDFQIVNWGTPVSDLLYCFSTVNAEVRERRDEVVTEYHAELVDTLRALGATNIPELHELLADIRRRSLIEVMHAASGTALCMAPPSVGITFATICDDWLGEGPHPRDLALDQEPFISHTKRLFAVWERERVLDSLLQ